MIPNVDFSMTPNGGSGQGGASGVAPFNYLGGLAVTYRNATSVFISPGMASANSPGIGVSHNDAVLVSFPNVAPLNAVWIKTTAAWAAGSNAGMLDTGSVASGQWYAMFLIYNTTTGAADIVCTQEAAASNPNQTLSLPSDFNRQRYIMSFKTDGSGNIIPFSSNPPIFTWNPAISTPDINGATLGTGNTLHTLPSIPLGFNMRAHVRGVAVTDGAHALLGLIYSPLEGSPVADTPIGNTNFGNSSIALNDTFELEVVTNTSAQIGMNYAFLGANSITVYVSTIGWTDLAIQGGYP